MRYEHAKALVSLAVAGSQRGDRLFADRTLRAARRLFVQEKIAVWSALVDQLRAVLAFHDSRFDQAHRLSASAWRVLTTIMVPGRAAHSQILLARLWLRAGHADRARAVSREAVELLGDDISPSLRFHASLLEGEIHEAQGKMAEAWACFQSSRREIEDLRGRVETEDLRISVLKDKVAVYEHLVALCLDPPPASLPLDEEGALALVQEAKSRALADRTRAPLEAPGHGPVCARTPTGCTVRLNPPGSEESRRKASIAASRKWNRNSRGSVRNPRHRPRSAAPISSNCKPRFLRTRSCSNTSRLEISSMSFW